MEPGVPFALLAAAELLAVAAALGLAAVALGRVLRGRGSVPLVVGALCVGLADVLTAGQLGTSADNLYAGLRLVGFLALAVGFLLTRPGSPWARRSGTVLTVAPLGASVRASLLAGGAGLLAAAAALWALRARPAAARLLAGGLSLDAVAAALSAPARTSTSAALALLALRAAGSLLVLAAVAVLGRHSVLSKVVQAILAGTVLTAVATAGVVGTDVASQLRSAQTRQVGQAAVGELADLQADAASAQQFASVLASCTPVQRCGRGETFFSVGTVFAATVSASHAVAQLGGSTLDEAALLGLARQPAVEQALATPGFAGSGFVLLPGAPERLVALGVAAHRVAADPAARPDYVTVYGSVLDRTRMVRARSRSTFDATLLALPDGGVIASSLSPAGAAQLAARAGSEHIARTVDAQPVASSAHPQVLTRPGQGSAPTAAYAVLAAGPDPVGLLAVSAPTSTILSTQRTVLDLLFLALVAIGLAVAGLAFLLGRRVVDPVRRLTVAAAAVTSGDLSARAEVAGEDEVAELSRAFDAMTTSLIRTAEELRSTAVEEAVTRDRLATVLDAMGDALLVTDATGVVTSGNPAATRLLGPVTGRPLVGALPDSYGRPLPVPGEGTLGSPDGPVPVELSASPLPDGRGQVVVVRDVSAQRQAERMKTQFLANVSHELRTPLTPICAYADMLRRRRDLPEPATAFAQEIADAGRRMTRVVNLLVDVAAIDAGRAVAAPERVDVSDFVDARLAAWRARVPARAADLRRRVTSGAPEMLVDVSWLTRALDELLDNAVKFSPPGTPVVFAAAVQGDRIRLSIRDSGEGIGPQAQRSLFTDFEQADGSATRVREGLGLGLAFARRAGLVAGFTVVVVESAPGNGSVFALDVPVAGPRAPSHRREISPRASRARRRTTPAPDRAH